MCSVWVSFSTVNKGQYKVIIRIITIIFSILTQHSPTTKLQKNYIQVLSKYEDLLKLFINLLEPFVG